ncbi:unnamed protein product [Calypogeia fissa]
MAGGQGAARWKDLARVASGVSLVVNEMLVRSPAIGKLKAGDFVGSTTTTLNYVRNAVADISGLTQGRLCNHMPSDPSSQSATISSSSSSVSHFDNPTTVSSGSAHDDKPQMRVSQPEELFRAATPISADGNSGRPSEGRLGNRGTEVLKNELYGATCISGRDNFSPSGEKEVLDEVPQSSRNSDSAGRIPGGAVGVLHEETKSVEPLEREAEGGVAVDLEGSQIGVTMDPPRPVVKKRKVRERRVPSTPLGRAMGFAGLGAGLAWGSVQESARRLWGGQKATPPGQSVLSPFMSEQNSERIAVALCRMRGAALKVGQMLSIQDESMVPAPLLAALEIVRQGADVMPRTQLNNVLDKELGPGWGERLGSFDYEPIAAASIGQVHRAVLKDGREVAMKVQYPGVAASINSDIDNVKLLLEYTNLIPKGLYLDQALNVAKEELRRECDYGLEAINQKKFRKLLKGEPGLYVPLVIDEFSSKGVLTTELVKGVPIDKVAQMDQSIRNRVGCQLLDLTLRELFVFRFMQTDPNWGNFLYEEETNTINLIDFGAARGFAKQFVDDYMQMVFACANKDREQIIEMSTRLGFLTGEEEEVMLDAHTAAGFATGEPFSKLGGYDFRNSNLPRRISELGATMLRHRLTPPPDEAYSLHRKLSGAFLACVKLGAIVPCREILLQTYEKAMPAEWRPVADCTGKAASA